MGGAAPKLIAVVEDDAGMCQAIERVLRAGGFATTVFESAEAALAGDAAMADCLVLDVHLPGISGFEFYGRLTPREGIPPVIFITAHDEPAFRDEAQRIGATSYLPKPFLGRTLLEAVLQAIDSRSGP